MVDREPVYTRIDAGFKGCDNVYENITGEPEQLLRKLWSAFSERKSL
jgi:hypothetical protein